MKDSQALVGVAWHLLAYRSSLESSSRGRCHHLRSLARFQPLKENLRAPEAATRQRLVDRFVQAQSRVVGSLFVRRRDIVRPSIEESVNDLGAPPLTRYLGRLLCSVCLASLTLFLGRTSIRVKSLTCTIRLIRINRPVVGTGQMIQQRGMRIYPDPVLQHRRSQEGSSWRDA